jgi:hypothetical protein
MTLDLTINEINIILQILGNAPYVSVAEVEALKVKVRM